MAHEIWTTTESNARFLLGLTDENIKLEVVREAQQISGTLARYASTVPWRLYRIVRTSCSLVVG